MYLVFLFENWMHIDNNWPWTSVSLVFSLFLSIFLYFFPFLSYSPVFLSSSIFFFFISPLLSFSLFSLIFSFSFFLSLFLSISPFSLFLLFLLFVSFYRKRRNCTAEEVCSCSCHLYLLICTLHCSACLHTEQQKLNFKENWSGKRREANNILIWYFSSFVSTHQTTPT